MFRKKFVAFIEKVKQLNGDPHFVAFGMAIGVFVAVTPTIPFHTILAIGLAILLKASKPAAILGVWVSNPFTAVFLYVACYKTGYFFIEDSHEAMKSIEILVAHLEGDAGFLEKITFLTEFAKIQVKPFMIMNVGGVILGLPSGLFAYLLTRKFIVQLRKKTHLKKR